MQFDEMTYELFFDVTEFNMMDCIKCVS